MSGVLAGVEILSTPFGLEILPGRSNAGRRGDSLHTLRRNARQQTVEGSGGSITVIAQAAILQFRLARAEGTR